MECPNRIANHHCLLGSGTVVVRTQLYIMSHFISRKMALRIQEEGKVNTKEAKQNSA